MKTMVDNAKIARMEKDIKETDTKVKNLKTVPPSTTADAGKVLTVNEDGSLSWQQKGAGGGMKAFFDAGGKCSKSTVNSFDGIINFSDTSYVTDMSYMFADCDNIKSLPLFDTSKVTNMKYMFSGCDKLTSFPLFDTSKVTDMSGMFYDDNCTEVPLFDTSKVTNMYQMFWRSLIVIVPAFDVSNVTNMSIMFQYCSRIKEIHMLNICTNLDISSSTKFTREALLEIIGNLKTVTTTKVLTMGSTNLAKLTEEDKAIATNKGWTLA